MQNVDMKRAANDNYGLLVRHPRLLTPAHNHGCSRDNEPKENSDTDQSRELAMIYARVQWLNWMEFTLMKKRTVANDSQGEPTGRRVVS